MYGDGLAVLLGDFVGGFFCGALVEVDCDDTRPFAGAVQCGLAADARAGTGNKDDASLIYSPKGEAPPARRLLWRRGSGR